VLRFIAREFLTACQCLQLFFRKSPWRVGGFSGFVAPQGNRVREDDVTEDAAEIVVAEINRGIKLEIACDVAGESDGR
jgi:hypothetical protein